MSDADTAPERVDWLALDDAALLADCDVHIYKASGPGGQHRNKVSSAVRLRHRPTATTAHGDDSRSQHTNKRLAIKRLRMQIALNVRRPIDLNSGVPESVAACVQGGRLQLGPKNEQFWPVAQWLLDLLDCSAGRLADVAERLGVSTSNLVVHLKKDRHLFAAVQALRKRHGHGPLK